LDNRNVEIQFKKEQWSTFDTQQIWTSDLSRYCGNKLKNVVDSGFVANF